jgi:hypothetical protein
MPLEQVGLEAVFDTKEFQRGQRIYEQGLNRVNNVTKKSADAMSKTGKDMAVGWQAAAGAAGLLATAAIASFNVMEAGWAAANAAMEKRGMESSAERIEKAWADLSFKLGSSLIPAVEDLGDAAVAMIGKMEKGVTVFGDMVAKIHANIASLQAYGQVMTAAGESEEKFAGSIWAHRYQLGKALTDQEEMIKLQERQKRAGEAAVEAYEHTMDRYAEATKPLVEDGVARDYEKVADAINATFQRIADEQERAWQQYGQDVAKEIEKGQKKLADVTLEYQQDVAEEIEDYNDDRLKAEEDLNKSLLQAQQDCERFELDEVQSERRYQYERARLVAEGDTLALEQLDELHELEEKEAAENEALRVKQAQETQDALVEAMEAAGRAQAEALAEALAEQLKEMEEQSREEMAEQEQANKDRLAELAAGFAEQQHLADEDYQRSLDKADQNYDRQQEDLGRNLARQEELQEISGDEVAYILEQYYGPDGLNREIMEGYYEWLEERAVVSATTVAAAMAMSAAPEVVTPEFHPVFGMQEGGVLRGPAMAYVEPGTTEAFVPLSGPGAGGAFTHEFLNALKVAGLERGSPGDVNAIAREMARSLTQKIRSRRRT